MERVFSDDIIEEQILLGINKTKEFRRCSYITKDGKFLSIFDHYEVIKWITQVKQLADSTIEAEELLNDLGYIKYSFIGYITLPDYSPTLDQYKSIQIVLKQIARTRDEVTIQIFGQPRFYINYSVKDIKYIIDKIKTYYSSGQLLP